MTLRYIFEGLGDIFEWTFQLFPFVGNGINLIFILVLFGFAGYWLSEMRKHQRAGQN